MPQPCWMFTTCILLKLVVARRRWRTSRFYARRVTDLSMRSSRCRLAPEKPDYCVEDGGRSASRARGRCERLRGERQTFELSEEAGRKDCNPGPSLPPVISSSIAAQTVQSPPHPPLTQPSRGPPRARHLRASCYRPRQETRTSKEQKNGGPGFGEA